MGRRLVWETVQYWLPLLSVLISCCATHVLGFPTGAGSCTGGTAAVGGQHVRPGAVEATFVDRGIGISIGGTPVTPGQNLGLIAGDELEVVITATTNLFRGALIRLEPLDGQSVLGGLTPGTNAAIATICQAPVVGINHFNNETKTTFSGTLMVEALGPATLDITVVEINSPAESIYMYGGYNISFVSSPGAAGASTILQRTSIVFYFPQLIPYSFFVISTSNTSGAGLCPSIGTIVFSCLRASSLCSSIRSCAGLCASSGSWTGAAAAAGSGSGSGSCSHPSPGASPCTGAIAAARSRADSCPFIWISSFPNWWDY